MTGSSQSSDLKIEEEEDVPIVRFGHLSCDYSKRAVPGASVSHTDEKEHQRGTVSDEKGGVKFGHVHVHKHRMTLGDHPDADGVPVMLAWDSEEFVKYDNVDDFEASHEEEEVQNHSVKRISVNTRNEIARRNHTSASIKIAEEERMLIVNSRDSRNSSERDEIERSLEKLQKDSRRMLMQKDSKKMLVEKQKAAKQEQEESAKKESCRLVKLVQCNTKRTQSLEFSDSLSGHVTASSGKTISVEFNVKVVIPDLDMFMDQKQDAKVSGSAKIPGLSSGALSIFNGSMKLIEMYEDGVSTSQMRYELPMENRTGERFTLVGIKINPDHHVCLGCGEAYDDFSQLRCDIHQGDCKDGEIVGRGMLQTSPMNVLQMAFSFHGSGAFTFKRHFLPRMFVIYFRAFFPKKQSVL